MATVLPAPNKKQIEAAAAAEVNRVQSLQIPPDSGSIRLQFQSSQSGAQTGTQITLPVADSSPRNLESILNNLLSYDASSKQPFTFLLLHPQTGAEIPINLSIYHSVLQQRIFTTEDVLTLRYTPQAVFRVKSVTRCSSSISGHGSAILCTQFAPHTSSRMATGSGDNTVRIWDTDTDTPVSTLKGHTGWVLVVSWSPEGHLLATGSMDNTGRLWDPKTGEPIGQPLRGHSKWLTSLAWEPFHLQHSPSSPLLATASKDATIRIWNTSLQRTEIALSGHKSSITSIRWSGQDHLYSASQDRTIKIWDPRSGRLLSTLSTHSHWVNHLALSTDHILRTSYHSPEPSKLPPPSSPAERRARALARWKAAATHDGTLVERLASASDDFTLFLWHPNLHGHLSSGTGVQPILPVQRLLGHQKAINHVSFSPDGRLLASASFDSSIRIWAAAAGGQYLFTLRAHVGSVYQCCFSADSRLLVSASRDTTVKVWDVTGVGEKRGGSGKAGTGKAGSRLVNDLPGHRDEVFAVDWSCDGEKVASGGKDRAVRLWKH